MPTYAVKFTKSAQKEAKKLPAPARLRILRAIYKLTSDPRIGDVRPMVGAKSWRLRVGNYRVVYDIIDRELIILIIRIGHRQNI